MTDRMTEDHFGHWMADVYYVKGKRFGLMTGSVNLSLGSLQKGETDCVWAIESTAVLDVRRIHYGVRHVAVVTRQGWFQPGED